MWKKTIFVFYDSAFKCKPRLYTKKKYLFSEEKNLGIMTFVFYIIFPEWVLNSHDSENADYVGRKHAVALVKPVIAIKLELMNILP